MKSLDNGGRFFNIFTKANDGMITGSELSKVGGFGQSDQKLMLFLQMSISKLDDMDKAKIVSKLKGDLKGKYKKFLAQELLPSEMQSKKDISSNFILTGIPKLKESKSDISGFIYVPIQAGDVTSFTMVPIVEAYDFYELIDEKTEETFVIAHAKTKEYLPEKCIKIGGILKEMKNEEKKDNPPKTYLEIAYQMDV